MKKVDIALISYNQELYISQAIESILMQETGDDIELNLVIADDCSTDKTLDIIKSYLSQISYTYQILESSVNLGISKNYKRIFENCKGDYIAILEGDDYWASPYHIENHIRFMDKNRFCSLSMNSIVRKIQDKQEFITPGWDCKNDFKLIDTKCQITQGNQLGNLSACVIRTESIKKLPVSMYDLYIADWMLGVMLSQQGLLAILKEPTSVYRLNSNSQWASLSKQEQKKELIRLSHEYDDFQKCKFHHYWEIYRNNLTKKKSTVFRKMVKKIKSLFK